MLKFLILFNNILSSNPHVQIFGNPCWSCRKNLHEKINKMLHQKSNLTYNDVRERYEHLRARCTKKKTKKKKTKKKKIKKCKTKKEKGCVEPYYGI